MTEAYKSNGLDCINPERVAIFSWHKDRPPDSKYPTALKKLKSGHEARFR